MLGHEPAASSRRRAVTLAFPPARACSCTTTRPASRAARANAASTCNVRPGVRPRSIPAASPNTFASHRKICAIRSSLPDAVGFADASLVEPLACVLKSLRRSGLREGDRCYIIGLGVMGQLHVLAARSLGAEVVGGDFLATRRELAERNGAIAVHPDDAKRVLGDGADVVICGPGTPKAMQAAVEAAGPAATVVMFTPFPPEEPVHGGFAAVVLRRSARRRELLVRSRRHARRTRAGYGGAPSPPRRSARRWYRSRKFRAPIATCSARSLHRFRRR